MVSFGIVAVSTSRWRWLFLLHLVLTMLVVSATGNHWWLDGIVAVVLLVVAIALVDVARRLATSWRINRSGGRRVSAEETVDLSGDPPAAERVEDEVFN